MRNPAQPSDRLKILLAIAAAALFGAALGAASAQGPPPGQLDAACAAQCIEHGNDREFCGRVCWVPDPQRAAEGADLDWPCLSACRQRGGKLADCAGGCRR